MVYLVGAGPGDPGLITVKGIDVLRKADVVLYDRLANPALLEEAPSTASLIDVGKTPRVPDQTRQERINELLVCHGRKARVVVRLKGGDPFVFGRGGEEALALQEAGIQFEVVPGVTSAVAVPASGGIPVTHRGVANAFGVFTGHATEDVLWDAAVAMPTAVFLMGVDALPGIVERLIAHGRAETTPIAVVSKGTWPEQQVVRGTLANIVGRSQQLPSPAVIVVGDVVSLDLPI